MDFTDSVKLFAIILYGVGVLILIMLSAFAIRLIAKHGEKPGLASIVSLIYIGLEIIILTAGAVTLGLT